MTYSSIVSYHTNTYTCGVARFNAYLAREMNIAVVSVSDYIDKPIDDSLLSLKFEEFSDGDVELLTHAILNHVNRFDLFLHGVQNSEFEQLLIRKSVRIFVASLEHADELRLVRPDVRALFAPGAPFEGEGGVFDLTLLTFGMAHKIRADQYIKLGNLLTADGRTAQLEISTALHEGKSFSDDFFSVNAEISAVFNGNVSFLGFLADGEVSRRLRAADALVAFFPSGVRENNTTVLSAMAHGCAVITNLDGYSPKWMKHGESIFDIDKLENFPTNDDLKRVGKNAIEASGPFNFLNLGATLLT